MSDELLEKILSLLLEKGGLPAAVVAGLAWIHWKFPSGRVAKPEGEVERVAGRVEAVMAQISKVSDGLDRLADESHERHVENVRRFAVLETEVRNLKEQRK